MTYSRRSFQFLRPGGKCLCCLYAAAITMASVFATGCSTTRVHLAPEIASNPDQVYEAIVRPASLVGVVVAPDENVVYDTLDERLYPRLIAPSVPEVITFDSIGGTVDVENQTVTGTDSSGGLFKEGFVNLLYLQVKEVDLAKKFVSPMELTCEREAFASKPRRMIEHGSSPCWDVIEFNNAGGRYDSTTRAIVGTTKRGTEVSVDVDDILQSRTSRRNLWKTTRLAVALGGLFVFANGALHFWDGY